MKKTILIFFVLFTGLVFQGFSQDIPKDFFTGTWEITIFGTPEGDAKMNAKLARVDGKLTGVLIDPNEPDKAKFNIDKVEEKTDSIVIFFFAEGMDINLDLKKTDNHNLEGSLLGMFDSKAKRIGVL
jgi:hypothetical protein